MTLHLSGKYKAAFQQQILANMNASTQDFFVCIHENQWHHHFESGNYVRVKQLTEEAINDILQKKQFIKLAVQIPLQPWIAVPALLENAYREIIKLLKN